MKLRQMLKSKRGMALENAILFMLIIFTLCALLTRLTLLGHYQVKIEKMTLQQDIEIEQIGEDYLASVKAKTTFTDTYENYAYEVDGNALTVWRKTDENKNAVLYVEAELTADEELNVNVWRYSLPTQTE